MSTSILSALADDLDVSPEQAQKLLIAMLREVRKRARREGVRLPEFGTFRESDGRLTFEPSPSLTRAVNHRFEGLQSEELDTAPNTDDDQDSDDGGPSTITLGYQDSDWSPLDEESSSATADDEEDEEPDTEDFEVPSPEETADTDEFRPSGPAARESEQEAGQPDRLRPDTDSYVGGADGEGRGPDEAETAEPQGAENRQTAADEEHDSLSDIWASDEEEEETDDFSFPDEDPAPASPSAASPTESTPEPEPAPAADPTAPSDASPPGETVDRQAREPAPSSTDTSADPEGSTGARVFAGLLVVLLLGGAGWYVLGQQGTLQPPQETFSQVKKQVRPLLESGSPASNSPPSTQADDGSTASNEGPSATDESSGESATDQTSSTTQASAAQAIDPANGGWTIVVGSRTERATAQSLADKYRAMFEPRNLPVDVVAGTVNNTTRYRVGVGQFDSQADAQRFLENATQELPEGAWTLDL